MGFHTFDPAKADRLEDPSRYRFCSREELVGALDGETSHLVDLGSGTGFYTRELAPFVDRISAVDIQPAMHELFSKNGVPANVDSSRVRPTRCRLSTTRSTLRSRR